ncbi:MAG: hypothetical protein ACYS47_08710 [Planctomycetota bacterium]|jgi:hypothetical protein
MGTQESGKAYKQRSIVGTIAKVLLALAVLIALAGLGFRFGLPKQWDSLTGSVLDCLDGQLLGAFDSLSATYVDAATDMESDEKRSWKERLGKMASALKEQKGSAPQRGKLRDEYDGIVVKMQDGDLSKAELDPFRENVDSLLQEIDTHEAKKKE